jgi:hypothetical protein
MQIDERDEQFSNAEPSMHKRFEPGSNAIRKSEPHSRKQDWQSVVTEEGMQIDERDEQFSNAEASMDKRFEPDSNATLNSHRHLLKQVCETSRTDDGMQIDETNARLQKPMRSVIKRERDPHAWTLIANPPSQMNPRGRQLVKDDVRKIAVDPSCLKS